MEAVELLLLQCSALHLRTARVGENVDLMYYIGKAIKTTHRRRETEWDASSASHTMYCIGKAIKTTHRRREIGWDASSASHTLGVETHL